MLHSHVTVECALDACPTCKSEVPVESSASTPNARCSRCGQSLWYRKRMIDGVVVLQVIPAGRFAYEDVIGLFESLSGLGNVPRIVVDLSGVEYVNSGFVAGLVGLTKRARSSTGRLVLCGLRPRICEILARTQLDKFFDISDNEEGALSTCRCRTSNRSGD